MGVQKVSELLNFISRLRYYLIELKNRLSSLKDHAESKREIFLTK